MGSNFTLFKLLPYLPGANEVTPTIRVYSVEAAFVNFSTTEMTFIFHKCHRSLDAATHAKYEHDIQLMKSFLIILKRKKWKNNGTEEIGSVIPTPDPNTLQ